MIDLINKKTKFLTVLERDGKTKSGGLRWKCLCFCGNIKTFPSQDILRRPNMSCGCMWRELVSIKCTKNIVGQVFGYLTVISKIHYNSDLIKHLKSKAAYWLCKCKCGNEIIARSSSLKRKNTTSCGCRFRKSEEVINKALQLYEQGMATIKICELTDVSGNIIYYHFKKRKNGR